MLDRVKSSVVGDLDTQFDELDRQLKLTEQRYPPRFALPLLAGLALLAWAAIGGVSFLLITAASALFR